LCVIDFASFYNFSILFLKSLDSVVFFVSHLRVTYIQYSTHKKYIDHLWTCLTCLKRQLWTCLWYGAFDFCKTCYNNKLKSLFFSFLFFLYIFLVFSKHTNTAICSSITFLVLSYYITEQGEETIILKRKKPIGMWWGSIIYQITQVFSGVRVTLSLVLYMFWRSLFVLLSFFFRPLCCLFFFNIRILITSLWYFQPLLSVATTLLFKIQVIFPNIGHWITENFDET
jgi:hypothetical protein